MKRKCVKNDIAIPPAIIPAPMIVAEWITCICVAMAAPDDIPEMDIELDATSYVSIRQIIKCVTWKLNDLKTLNL